MNRTLNIIGSFTLILALAIGILLFTIPNLDSAEGGGMSASLSQTEFEVDNSDRAISTVFEEILTIDNNAGSPKNISIKISSPEDVKGEETGSSKEIYPHIFTDSGRRKDKGRSYTVQVAEGDTRFYPNIEVNFSAFADTYSFEITIDNKDDKEIVDTILVSVEVTPYNDIDIEFDGSDQDEKTVTAGRQSLISIKLTNIGNIYQEEVSLEIEDLPDNLTFVAVQFPAPGGIERKYVNPQTHEIDSDIYLSVILEAASDSGEGEFLIIIIVTTPDNTDPSDGHKFVKSEITITTIGDPTDKNTNIETQGEFPKAIFGGSLAVVIVVMVAALKFLVLDKDDEEEGAWGDAPQDSWGADEWGEDEDYDAGAAPEEYEAPITTQRGPPSRAASRSKPAPRTAPAPVPKAKGPAHVKCPKCQTGIKVSNPKRPLTIGCPKCSIKFTLKGKPGVAPGPKPRPKPATSPTPKTNAPAHVKCPKCHTGVKVSNPKRPLTIGCPKCSTKFTLKGKPGAAPGPKPGPKAGAPKAKGPALISCPKCSTKFKVSNPKRPLKVACPKCKTGLNLK